MRQIAKNLSILVLIGSMVLGSTRVAYTRPGLMMRVPTSSNQKTPYLFRTGFGTEIHNFDPFNTAKRVYAEMEFINRSQCGCNFILFKELRFVEFA